MIVTRARAAKLVRAREGECAASEESCPFPPFARQRLERLEQAALGRQRRMRQIHGAPCSRFSWNFLGFSGCRSSLISGCDAIGVKWRRCVQHLWKNVQSKFAGTPTDLIDELKGLARLTTKEAFQLRVQQMRNTYPKCGLAMDYIVEARESFAAYIFIDKKHRSFGQVTNNPIEQTWQFLTRVRTLPIVSMFQDVRARFSKKLLEHREKARARAEADKAFKGGGNRNKLVPVVVEKLQAAVARLKEKTAKISNINERELTGNVRLSSSIEVKVTLNKKDVLCDCAIVLVMRASEHKKYGTCWSVFGTEFLHKHNGIMVGTV